MNRQEINELLDSEIDFWESIAAGHLPANIYGPLCDTYLPDCESCPVGLCGNVGCEGTAVLDIAHLQNVARIYPETSVLSKIEIARLASKHIAYLETLKGVEDAKASE